MIAPKMSNQGDAARRRATKDDTDKAVRQAKATKRKREMVRKGVYYELPKEPGA